jgi:hypothetical protein
LIKTFLFLLLAAVTGCLTSCYKKSSVPLSYEDSLYVKLSESEPGTALIYSYFNRYVPSEWISSALHEPDSIFHNVYRINAPFNEPDSLAFASVGDGQLYIDHYTAKKFFVIDSLPYDEEPVYPVKVPLGKYSIYSLQNLNFSTDCKLYFTSPDKMIGALLTYIRNGLQFFSTTDEKGNVQFAFKYDFGNGNGAWWDEYFIYRLTDSALIPVAHIPSDVTDAAPLGLTRYKNYECRLTDTLMLGFTAHIVSSLALPDREIKLVNDTEVFHPSKFPKDEKMVALGNSYFTNDVDRLFLHAYRKEILSSYLSAPSKDKKFIRKYCHDLLFSPLIASPDL